MTAPRGNKNSLVHGAHAAVDPVRLADRVQNVYDRLAQAVPVREHGQLPAADRGVVVMLATVECRLEDVGIFLDREGSLDRKGKPRSAAGHERRLQSHALRLMRELGLTPQSRAKLGVNLARTVDLAQAMSHPDPAERQRLLAEAGLDTGRGGDLVVDD